MINAVIVEDSRLARQELKELLKAHPQIKVVAEADTAEEAIGVIRKEKPQLLFMDIHLPGKNGFEVLQELDRVPLIIFTTAYDQYALQAFNYHTVDYLLKPVAPEHLLRAVNRVEAWFQRHPEAGDTERMTAANRIFVKDGNRSWFVTLAEIRLFESRGNYTQIHFGTNCPLMLKSLQQMDQLLDPQEFIRVNRQQIINTAFIGSVAEDQGVGLQLTLTTGEIIAVSRRQASRIRALFRV